MCKQCSRQNTMINGLFTEGGEFHIDFEIVAGAVVGVVAAKNADILLDKVEMLKENAMLKDGIKVAVGVLLTQTDMPVLTGAGYGMIGFAAGNLINAALVKAGVIKGLPYREQPGTQLQYINGVPYLNGMPYKQQPGSELQYINENPEKKKEEKEETIEIY